MKVSTVVCDVCGARTPAEEAGRWFQIIIMIDPSQAVNIRKWEIRTDVRHTNFENLDVCGTGCVIKKVSEFLGKAKTAIAA